MHCEHCEVCRLQEGSHSLSTKHPQPRSTAGFGEHCVFFVAVLKEKPRHQLSAARCISMTDGLPTRRQARVLRFVLTAPQKGAVPISICTEQLSANPICCHCQAVIVHGYFSQLPVQTRALGDAGEASQACVHARAEQCQADSSLMKQAL